MRLFAILLLGCASLVQATELTVQTLEFQGKNIRGEAYEKGQITMPFVKARQPTGEALASKINDLLFISRLLVMAPRQPGAYLTGADRGALEGTQRQQFSVSRNDGRILTLVFDNEVCGAYCENYRLIYSFDARNGQLITANNLFTTDGLRELARRMGKEQVSRYRQQLVSLNKELKAAKTQDNADDIADINDRIELNTNCLNEKRGVADTPAATRASLVQAAQYYRYELDEKSLKVTAERCSNHAQRALDDVDEVTLALPYADLAPYLSTYGKAVLLNEGQAQAEESIYGQLLRGTLAGNTAITMLLEKNSDNTVSGTYFYDKFRAPIRLDGTLIGPILELNEQIEGKPEATATFRLTKTSDGFKGQWISKTGKKQFEVRVGP